jgi:hypothetical protein
VLHWLHRTATGLRLCQSVDECACACAASRLIRQIISKAYSPGRPNAGVRPHAMITGASRLLSPSQSHLRLYFLNLSSIYRQLRTVQDSQLTELRLATFDRGALPDYGNIMPGVCLPRYPGNNEFPRLSQLPFWPRHQMDWSTLHTTEAEVCFVHAHVPDEPGDLCNVVCLCLDRSWGGSTCFGTKAQRPHSCNCFCGFVFPLHRF